MQYHELRQQLYTRMAMLHEAGHAVVAMHYGKRVFSYGVDPIPHCLPISISMNTHDKGVLMCAGAMMCKHIYGEEWGGECSDYPMARTLGDLEEFKDEASILCAKYMSEAKFLVEARLGEEEGSSYFYGIDSMSYDSPIAKQCIRAGDKARLPNWAKKLLMKWASWQIKNPKIAAKI